MNPHSLQKPPDASEVLFNIGPYQVIGTIGKGGMGHVYLAFDPESGRRIAIKKIRQDYQEYPQVHERFLKEAKIASQLTHPSIIPIYSIHKDEKEIYYTMPYIQGETLKEVLKKARAKKQAIPAFIRILISISQAIAYAHSNQVLHRDIKPENIIIGNFGEVMILDWGLAI
jgi:eukaryotic-like serine/threonine-protein kinase